MLTADKAYHSNFHEVMLHIKGIQPLLLRHGTDDNTNPGRLCWVVERTLARLHQFRRRRVRYERRSDIQQAFLFLEGVFICLRTFGSLFC